MTQIEVIRPGKPETWEAMADPPGEIGSRWASVDTFTSTDGRFTTGLWERDPDTWSFERPYDEVALILAGDADIETDDGRVLTIGPGDVLITPKGSKGTWRIRETIRKFYAIYEA